MTSQEIAICVTNAIPVVFVVQNNSGYMSIRGGQRKIMGRHVGSEFNLPNGEPYSPNFTEIAARPNMTEAFLRDFLTKPHDQARALSAMPGFLMPSYQADAAIAYLMSLKPK